MKKIKLMVLILSAFFAFGMQSAFSQTYVDAQTAKGRLFGKIDELTKSMDEARKNSTEQAYYDAKTRFDYFSGVVLSLKSQATVEDAIERTAIAIATSNPDQADMVPVGTPAVKQAMEDVREEARSLLKL